MSQPSSPADAPEAAIEETSPAQEFQSLLDNFLKCKTREAFEALPALPSLSPSMKAWSQAYINGCSAVGEPIEKQDVECLEHFNEAIEKTRSGMLRGNEETEVKRSAGYSCFLGIAGKKLKWDLEAWPMGDMARNIDSRVIRDKIDQAALVTKVGAGHCQEYARKLMAEMLPYLRPGDTIEEHTQGDFFDLHMWVAWRRPGRPTLYGCAWSYGPAHLEHHSNYRSEMSWSSWNHEEADSLSQRYQAKQMELDEIVPDRLPTKLIEVVTGCDGKIGDGLKASHWSPQPAISPEFAKRVADAQESVDDSSDDQDVLTLMKNLSWVPIHERVSDTPPPASSPTT